MDVFDSNWKAKEDTMLAFSVDKKKLHKYCDSVAIYYLDFLIL